MNTEKIVTAITNAQGTDSAVKIAFKACAGLRLERGLMAQVAKDTTLTAVTIKLYTVGGEILAKSKGEYVAGDSLKIRTMLNSVTSKGDDYRALTGKELDQVIEDWDGYNLGELFSMIQDLRHVEPITPEDSDEDSQDDSQDSEDTPTPLVDVVLSHLPHLTPEELALVADSVAQLMALKTLASV